MKLTSTALAMNREDIYALYPFLPAGSVGTTSITATLTPAQRAELIRDGIVESPKAGSTLGGMSPLLLAGLAIAAFTFLR